MISRRAIFAAFAPRGEAAFQGALVDGVCCATYDAKPRRTWIRFLMGGNWRYAFFDHDHVRVSRPALNAPEFPGLGALPKIRLKVEAGELRVYESKREAPLRSLMPVAALSTAVVSYPSPAHPDLTVLWSVDGRLYFTNNDYKNVYRLPERMTEEWEKPRVL